MEVGAKLAATHVVFVSITSRFFGGWAVRGTAEQRIDDDLGLIVDHSQALTDRRLEVDVVHGASIHKDTFTCPNVLREDEWDRSRREGSLRQVAESKVCLVEFSVGAGVHLGAGQRHHLLEVTEARHDVLHEIEEG